MGCLLDLLIYNSKMIRELTITVGNVGTKQAGPFLTLPVCHETLFLVCHSSNQALLRLPGAVHWASAKNPDFTSNGAAVVSPDHHIQFLPRAGMKYQDNTASALKKLAT